MPHITEIPLQFTVEDVTHAWGSRREKLASPAMREKLSNLLQQIDANHWVNAAISYQIHRITETGDGWLRAGDIKVTSSFVANRLQHATHLICGVCTLGDRFVDQVRYWFDRKQQLEAVLLDEIGTLLLYKLSEYFEDLMCQQAIDMGLEASSMLNPGDDDFDIRQQDNILNLAEGQKIGVHISGAVTLVPHKSLTTVIGLGKDMPTWDRAETCSRCRSRERCPHRQDLKAGVAA